MSITDPLEDELLSLGDSFAIQVVAKVDVAQRILRRIRDEGAVPSSPVIALPEGAMARFDPVADDGEARERFIDLLRRVLDDADLDGDSVVLHSTDGLSDLDDCPRAVVLRMFPPPADRGKPLPPALVDMAGDWVFGDLDPAAAVRIRVLGVELSIRVADAGGVLHGCASTGAWCDLLSGDVDDRVRTASISFGTAPHVAIAAGGPGCDDQGLLARFDLLSGVVPELAAWCAYACIDFEEAFDRLAVGLATSAWSAEGHAPANRVVGEAGDRAVPDAYPLQLLGPQHLRQLGDGVAGGDLDVVGDFGVLRIGDADEWLPDRLGRHTVRRDAWRVLAPLLLEADELSEVDRPRPRWNSAPNRPGCPISTTSSSSPARMPVGARGCHRSNWRRGWPASTTATNRTRSARSCRRCCAASAPDCTPTSVTSWRRSCRWRWRRRVRWTIRSVASSTGWFALRRPHG